MFPWQLFSAALGIISAAAMSVAGLATPEGDKNGMMSFRNNTDWLGFELGGIGNLPRYTREDQHEYGHWLQEQEMKDAYLPISGLTSLLGNLFSLAGIAVDYYGLGTEKEADELGGVNRGKVVR